MSLYEHYRPVRRYALYRAWLTDANGTREIVLLSTGRNLEHDARALMLATHGTKRLTGTERAD